MLKKPERIAAAVCTAAVLALGGCSHDISGHIPTASAPSAGTVPVASAPSSATSAAVTSTSAAASETTVTTTVSETTEETTSVPETSADTSETADTAQEAPAEEIIEVYKDYRFSDEYNDFISKCVFVGDSICSGLKAYDILPAKRVLAQGNVAARSIYDYTFKVNGDEMSILAALLELKPEYVVFSMGMNDVNMTSEATYCENYGKLLSEVESFLPDATLIVCSITPITYGETGKLFTRPEYIDSFNIAIKEYLDASGKWIYCDVAHEMKNSLNMLKSKYLGSADGVHLAPDAYYAILYQLCERMVDGRIYDPVTDTFEEPEKEEKTIVSTSDLIEPPVTAGSTAKEKEPESSDLLSGTIVLDDLE